MGKATRKRMSRWFHAAASCGASSCNRGGTYALSAEKGND